MIERAGKDIWSFDGSENDFIAFINQNSSLSAKSQDQFIFILFLSILQEKLFLCTVLYLYSSGILQYLN